MQTSNGVLLGMGEGEGFECHFQTKIVPSFLLPLFLFSKSLSQAQFVLAITSPSNPNPDFPVKKKRGKSFSCDGNMSALVPSLDMVAILMKTRSILALKSFVILQGAKIFYGFKLTSFDAARVEKVVSSFPSFIISLCSCRQSLHIPNENNNDM